MYWVDEMSIVMGMKKTSGTGCRLSLPQENGSKKSRLEIAISVVACFTIIKRGLIVVKNISELGDWAFWLKTENSEVYFFGYKVSNKMVFLL